MDDNMLLSGAPDHQAHMNQEEVKTWRTQRHETGVEDVTTFEDPMLVPEYPCRVSVERFRNTLDGSSERGSLNPI